MGIFSKITTLFRSKDIQQNIDDLEDILLEAGISPKLAYRVMDTLDKKVGGTNKQEKIIEVLQSILGAYVKEYTFHLPKEQHIFMFIGVNGVGKTTSIAKFIHYLCTTHGVAKNDLAVAAGDTFRAGAIEQLQKHCDILDVAMIKQQAGADPAAVVFDALSYVQARNIPYLIADTAGRMNNRKDLVAQLQKIYRLLQKGLDASQITSFLVLDGNSGLNTLTQVEDFKAAVPVDTIIVSKYDGSTKGGAIISIAEQHDTACAFLGTGEQYNDFKVFKKEEFLNDFFSN